LRGKKSSFLLRFFEKEIDPFVRLRFKRLLIAEGDKLGGNLEALNVIKTHMREEPE